MRLLIDSLMAVMLAALLAGILLYQRSEAQYQEDVSTTRASVRMIQQQVTFQAALAQTARNEFGFPRSVDPMWFHETLPRNELLGGEGPWMEIAGPDERLLLHPRQRIADGPGVATFWYNPSTGVVRARIPHLVSDARTLEVYNYVNNSSLSDLFGTSPTATAKDGEVEPTTPTVRRNEQRSLDEQLALADTKPLR